MQSNRYAFCIIGVHADLAAGGRLLIGNVPIEQTVKPILGCPGLLFLCLLVIAFVPWLSTALPRAFGQ
ncbi:hypothetical protein P0R31_31240 [Bradyrhizobium yuanmingense]|uniref:hypothetical protein n=1 Tax=Bradyrhizobium yuanmingense TaxID=108015 RepID=UPI0023B95CDB|nr:hypothetical protein [Bradyrhizobium yuanmingense]MDF0521726.1 hypothetical protein [Bradyrhizobium yuanmingense]